ncbi:hypothetical protein HW555_006545 [Spodoptera exigua]|uniref:Uncharacterized protein n=1 Tax=Spodoptera exigua TaxID=7107 RepID=A0A835GHW3_SPOEX|nr:hypothetical protein HW555_006545 [Spodoptera exigua]
MNYKGYLINGGNSESYDNSSHYPKPKFMSICCHKASKEQCAETNEKRFFASYSGGESSAESRGGSTTATEHCECSVSVAEETTSSQVSSPF